MLFLCKVASGVPELLPHMAALGLLLFLKIFWEERVKFVTFVGLVSKIISVSDFVLRDFTTLTCASTRMVLYRTIAKLPV